MQERLADAKKQQRDKKLAFREQIDLIKPRLKKGYGVIARDVYKVDVKRVYNALFNYKIDEEILDVLQEILLLQAGDN